MGKRKVKCIPETSTSKIKGSSLGTEVWHSKWKQEKDEDS